MTRRKLIDYIKHPYLLQELSIEELQQWIEDFPYSQNLRILLAQKIKRLGLEQDYPHVFHNAAMYSTDREILYHALHEDNPEISGHDDDSSIAFEQSNMPEFDPVSEAPSIYDGIDMEDSLTEKVDLSLTDESFPEDLPSSLTTTEDSVNLDPQNKESSEEELINEVESTMQQLIDGGVTETDYVIDQVTPEQDNTSVHVEVPFIDPDELKKDTPKDMRVESDENEHIQSLAHKIDNNTESDEIGLSPFSQWLISVENSQDVHDEDPDIDSLESEEDEDVDDLSSESLANLFADQGHKSQAIKMYEKLMLINPEKSSYFAAQIEKIKDS